MLIFIIFITASVVVMSLVNTMRFILYLIISIVMVAVSMSVVPRVMMSRTMSTVRFHFILSI